SLAAELLGKEELRLPDHHRLPGPNPGSQDPAPLLRTQHLDCPAFVPARADAHVEPRTAEVEEQRRPGYRDGLLGLRAREPKHRLDESPRTPGHVARRRPAQTDLIPVACTLRGAVHLRRWTDAGGRCA